MTKANKAALLSTLVFPGAGHFYLKRFLRGLAITAAAVMSLYFLISGVVTQALHIAEKIQRGEVQPDIEAISELVTAQPAGSEMQCITIASYVVLITWIIGIVDSFRIGRIQDKEKVSGD